MLSYCRIALVILFIFLMACNTPQRLTRKGDELALNGNDEDAVGFYYTALLKKRNYVLAQTGLKSSAQKVLNEKFEIFRRQVLDNKIEDAVKQYQNNKSFAANAESVGVLLDWPAEYDEVYTDIRQELSMKWFDEAILLINEKKFDVAERKIRELSSMDTAYRSVSVLRMNTVLLPLYNEGIRQFNAGKYRQANITFARLAAIDDGFMEVKEMLDKSKHKAITRYGVLPVTAFKHDDAQAFDDQLTGLLKHHQGQYNEVDGADQLKLVLESRGWSNLRTITDATNAGKNLGYNYVLLTELVQMNDTVFPRMAEKKIAYEAFTENIPNPYTDTYSYITRFKKIEYTDISESRRLSYEVKMTLIDCNSGNVVMTEHFGSGKSDELHKLECKGNPANLYESLPDGNYLPPVNKTWREQFIQAKKGLMSREVLRQLIFVELSQKIALRLKSQLK